MSCTSTSPTDDQGWRVHAFDPLAGFTPAAASRVLGIQANFWSHIDREPKLVDRQLFPRLLALAERAWVSADCRDWPDYQHRARAHLPLLERLEVAFQAGDLTDPPHPVTPMTSQQLVAAALAGQPVPRVPVGPLAVHFCAGHAGYNLRQYTTDATALADAVIRYHERFRPDAVWLSADTWVSAEAMGAKVGAYGDDQPFGGFGGPLVTCAADIERIPAPDVGSQGRYPLMLEALERIVTALGKEVFIVACMDQYPFSLAAALMDINEIMLKLYDDPPLVAALLERCAEYTLAYGTALAAAGADMLSGGDSPAGLVGPAVYEAAILPSERALLDKLKPAAGIPVSLHICGNATPILPLMAASGADVLELDHAVDLATACRITGPDIALWGNLDPVALLARGTPAGIRTAAAAAIAAARAANHPRFVLSSGCTLAVETPPENLDALVQMGSVLAW